MAEKIGEKWMSNMVQKVRSAIYDYKEVNRLIDGEQFSDPIIKEAIIRGVNRILATPPLINIGYDAIPDEFVVRAAIISLLETTSIVDTRNSVNYQDSGLQIQDTHQQEWQTLVSGFYQIFFNELKQWKAAKNIELSLGGINQPKYVY